MIGDPKRTPTAVFLHVATMGRYHEVLDEVLRAVRRSPLFVRSDLIEVNVVGDGDLATPFEDPRLRVIRRAADVTAFEHPTLAAIQHYAAAHPNAAILYLNCLGGRHTGREYEIRYQWRRLLHFLLVERFEACLEALESHDVCGVEWAKRPMPHMTSNNWWARAGYIATLPTPAECAAIVVDADLSACGPAWRDPESKRRHAGEFWIGLNERVKPFSLLPLSSLALPRNEYGVVPWWGLPGIDWRMAAERLLARRRLQPGDLPYLLRVAGFRVLSTLRRLKRVLLRRAFG